MKKVVYFLFLFYVITLTSIWAQDDQKPLNKDILRYQVEISTKTATNIQEIYDSFHNSFIDYEPALEKINILINEYNKAIQLIEIPKSGESLHELMKKLLSRVEKYFVYYKSTGRENAEINFEIYTIAIEIAKEADKLAYIYL